MKFIILSDIHLGPEGLWKDTLRKINNNVKKMLDTFIKKVEEIKPEFVVLLGDMIEDENEKKDLGHLSYIYILHYKKYPVPYTMLQVITSSSIYQKNN